LLEISLVRRANNKTSAMEYSSTGACAPIRDASAPKFLRALQSIDTSRARYAYAFIAQPFICRAPHRMQDRIGPQLALLKFCAKQITCDAHRKRMRSSNFRTMLNG
jgi:hypothetical protein